MSKQSEYDWSEFDAWYERETAKARATADPFAGPWRHRISRKAMIELLVSTGVVWAGWYKPAGLQAKYAEHFGAFMRGGFGPKRKLPLAR